MDLFNSFHSLAFSLSLPPPTSKGILRSSTLEYVTEYIPGARSDDGLLFYVLVTATIRLKLYVLFDRGLCLPVVRDK
jgi:hypothetical protein